MPTCPSRKRYINVIDKVDNKKSFYNYLIQNQIIV